MLRKDILIGKTIIGEGHPTFVIAEAGVNHNGDPELAKALIYEAKRCGADCIKFQTFRAESIVTQSSPKAAYQLRNTNPQESQFEMLKRLELSPEVHEQLINYCAELGIIFLSTPYDIEDIDFLDSLRVDAFKVASALVVENHFLEHMAKKGKPILLSTGMCTLAEVDESVRTVRGTGNQDIVVLQCTTNYPSELEDANLRAMQTMADAFNVLIGYSDHTRTLTSSIAAVALGACVIERHFTLDKRLPGPDQASSSEPDEFKRLVIQIREVEKCLGSGLKVPSPKERENAAVMRRSIVAKKFIKKGEVLSLDDVTLKRPANGLPGNLLKLILGRRAVQDIVPDSLIDLGMIQ